LAHKEKRVDDVGRESGGWFHYKNDPIGTPERLVAEDGSVAAEYERRAWGQLEQRAGAKASTPIRLQGQYWDEETGLAYNRWRYYDGEGRFVSADPLVLFAGTHVYAYSTNANTQSDPFGLIKLNPDVRDRLAGLPSGPGVYIIRADGKEYIGSSGNLKDRLTGSGKHDKAQELLNTAGAEITIIETKANPIDGLSARDCRLAERRAAKVVEQNYLNRDNASRTNSIPSLGEKKHAKYKSWYKPTESAGRAF
jgi:RHS repeat-associated protein